MIFERRENTFYAIENTKYGKMIGTSHLRQEDTEFYSDYRGFRNAEIKCEIKIFKAKIRELDVKLDTLTYVINNSKTENCKIVYAEVFKHIKFLSQKKTEYKNRIKDLQETFKKENEMKDKMNYILSKKNKKDKIK